MSRAGRLGSALAVGLAVLAAVYLLFGDAMSGGTAGGGYSEVADLTGPGGSLRAGGASLETHGVRPPTAEELAAEEAARKEAERSFPPAQGFHGTVRDGKGNPIQGATVKLLDDPPRFRNRRGVPDGAVIATTLSKADGSYLVGPAPEGAPCKLRGEARGFAATIEHVRARGARVDLILDRGGTLEVRVLDPEGKAVDGAQVLHEAGSVATVAVSGEDGLATLTCVPTGTGALLVSKSGLGCVRDRNVAVAPGETEKRTLVLTRGVEVAGTVTDAASQLPVPGAAVSIHYQNLYAVDPEPAVKTDEDGRFRLTAHVSGQEQMVVKALKEGFAEGRAWRNAAAKGEVAITLQKAGEAISGRVTGPDRQPVGGVEVTFTNLGREEADDVPAVESAEDGGFTLPLPPFAAPGWSLVATAVSDTLGIGIVQVKVPKPDAARAAPIEIELTGTGTVKGVVTDLTGQPIQGAHVTLDPDWSAGRNRPGRKRIPWQLMRVVYDGAYHNLSAVTGADGAYLLQAVPALEYKVTASFGVDRFTRPEAVSVESEATVEANVALGEGGTIEGWVLDSEDKPIAGAYVYARPATRNQGNQYVRPSARSQSDGRFVLRGITDENHDVRASASGFGGAAEKNVTRGMTKVTLRLKARGWITGVVFRNDEPYSGTFQVIARPVDKEGRSRNRFNSWRAGQQQRTFNTDDGQFEIRGLEAKDYTVEASTTQGLITLQPAAVTVVDGRASREVRLDLQAGAVLRGRLTNDESGEPIPRAWVYANPRAEGGAEPATRAAGNAQTDAEGRYEISGLGSGPYTITVWSQGGSNFSRTVDLVVGSQRDLDLVQMRPGRVQATVVDEEGEPIADARIHIRSSNGNYVNVNTSAMQKEGLIGKSYDWRTLWNTDESGTLMRYHVPPGDFTVSATRNGYKAAGAPAPVTVASGRVTQVQITLKKN